MENKEILTKVFDDNARAYDKYRPNYPKKVIDEIIELSGLENGDSILEIGCGTGQISMDFLKKGYQLTAVEKGKSLAKIAQEKMDPFPLGQVHHASFEDWQSDQKFQLVISAQAFHWIEKEKGIAKIYELLAENGSLALIWHLDHSQNTDFWKESNKVYAKYFQNQEGQKSLERRVAEYEEYILGLNFWKELKRSVYDWIEVYSKEKYLGLLSTFSTHMALEEEKRKAFFQDIETVIENQGNEVQRHYQTVLIFARK